MLQLPPALVQDLAVGRVVLFLGAGASLGAKSKEGFEPPLAPKLRDLLCTRFLGGKHKDSSLAWVAELAISETDLGTVQDYIAELLTPVEPAPFHEIIPSFRWRGIATVNFDRVIEAAFAKAGGLQELIPLFSDRDRIDEKLRSDRSLGLLKLHGCITRTHEPELPLILTVDQYITHRQGRERLFHIFEDWAREYPVIFVGHGGQDSDLRSILLELTTDLQMRPRYFLIRPNVSDVEKRLWESKRISTIDASFEEFLAALERDIPTGRRQLLSVVQVSRPIERYLVVRGSLGSDLESFLDNDADYVHESMRVTDGTPQAFYRGFDLGWFPILRGLDVVRTLTDNTLSEVIVRAEQERPTSTELYVIKAEAGAGKSVFLKRLAWEAATRADTLCIFLRPYGLLRYEPIREVYRVTQRRIFLFVDGAATHSQVLEHLLSEANRDRLPLTVLSCERPNLWNMFCEGLESFVTDSFQLRYLSRKEIGQLVKLLRAHNSLGDELTRRSDEECVEQFHEQAGRQLLVALHEATQGIPFEDILVNEYKGLQPDTARQLYLTVCVLNRLNIPVRAGLIARVHGIRFEDFQRHLFAPLEHVVSVDENPGTRDYYYKARHPEIAQVVFDRILSSSQECFYEYCRIVGNLNLSYSSDRAAFRGLLRAKAIRDLFPDHEMAKEIFSLAEQVGEREAYVFQQQANYERLRPNGDFLRAEELLLRARVLEPRDSTIVHTLAELKRTRAEAAKSSLEREKHRREARALLWGLLDDRRHSGDGRYARHTLVKIAIDELRDMLDSDDGVVGSVDAAIRKVETLLERGLQEHPGDEYILTAEAEFSSLLRDQQRALDALQQAFKVNRRDPFIASRLARSLRDRGDLNGARDTVRLALEANRGDKQLNYLYGMLLREGGAGDISTLLYHFQRAFTKGDRNYEAQFWFARYAFESPDESRRKASKEVFRHLRSAEMPRPLRVQVRDTMRDSAGNNRTFTGTVRRLEWAHGFVERDGDEDWVFFHRNDTGAEEWKGLSVGQQVIFEIGFTFGGAMALMLF